MKTILKTKQKNSLPVRLAMVLVFLLACAAFVLSVKYAGKNKNDTSVLSFDQNISAPKSNTFGGFYPKATTVSLQALGTYKIYYTLDGSEPSMSSEAYSEPLFIQDRTSELAVLSVIPTSPRWKPPVGDMFKGTVLRAICVNEKQQSKSKELIRTFFIKEKKYTLPVIALTVNVSDFFGYKNGIYVMGKNYEDKRDYLRKNLPLNLNWWEYPSNYLKRGSNAERPAHIEFYESNGTLAFEDNVGVRINGNATRGFSQKSLRICFDQKYGTPELKYPLFPECKTQTFRNFVLRNSGNDWNKTMFRDAFMQSLMEPYLDVQAYRPSLVFINGEYWGIHNIRERSDEHYLAAKYAIPSDSLIILEFGGDVFYGKKQDNSEFKELLEYTRINDMTQAHNYQYIVNKIDVNSFMDFIISNVYFCNSDWPNNNVKFWRFRSAESGGDSLGARDGRWRWMLYDTDWGFGYTGANAIQLNLLEKAKRYGSVGALFSGLLKNKEFIESFRTRFQFHLKNTFEQEALIAKIDRFESVLAPEMQEHIDRWREIGSYNNWEKQVQELRVFARDRPDIQLKQLDDFLK